VAVVDDALEHREGADAHWLRRGGGGASRRR
jgi:hypothetical protein